MLKYIKMTLETIESIMSLPKEDPCSVGLSIRMLAKHTPICLLLKDDNTNYYQVKVQDILESDITNEEMVEAITIGGWLLSNDKETLLRKI